MWSLGVLTYIMLSGKMPFKGTNFNLTLEKVLHHQPNFMSDSWNLISLEGKDFVKKLLERNIDNRLSAF